MDFGVIDLNSITSALGEHFDPTYESDYRGACPNCDEYVNQDEEECPWCGITIVWKNSKTWQQWYGSPTRAIERLTRPEPDEDDELGRWLLDQVGWAGFANYAEKKRWDKARKMLTENDLKGMVLWMIENTHRRGVLSRLLNWTDRKIRERKPAKPSKPVLTEDMIAPAPWKVPEESDERPG